MLNQFELATAIVKHPLVVAPDSPLTEAIALMSGTDLSSTEQSEDWTSGVSGEAVLPDRTHRPLSSADELEFSISPSCVLVVVEQRPVGILTERDVVRLGIERPSLGEVLVQDVMTSPVTTLSEKTFTDLFVALDILSHHQIRHLPLVDEHDCLLGLLTYDSLRRALRPVDLLRLRQVHEVMQRDVVCASPETSMLAIARLMTERGVSSVVIVEEGPRAVVEGREASVGEVGVLPSSKPDVDRLTASEPSLSGTLSETRRTRSPIGIITERDIVQLHALGRDLSACNARQCMSCPVFTVQANDSLWVVQELMNQRNIRRVIVVSEQRELLGIVTQSSLLQMLNPLELYKLTELLEEKVLRLEEENHRLLQIRTLELEQQVLERTRVLELQARREQLVSTIADQIRASLDLEMILNATVQGVRALLECDRVIVYQFHPDLSGIVIAEALRETDGNAGHSFLHSTVHDPCLSEEWLEPYRKGKIRIINDVYNEAISVCHQEMMVSFEVRAKIMVPIVVQDRLWGLLLASYRDRVHDWQQEEIELGRQLSIQVAIAIQNATAYQQARSELEERIRAEAALRSSEQRFRAIFDNMFQLIGLLAPDGTVLEANHTALALAGLQHDDVVGRPFWETFWWQTSPDTQAQLRQAIAHAAQGEFVRYEVVIQTVGRTLMPIDFSLRPLMNETGQVTLLIPEGRDLSEAKRIEAERQRALESLQASEQRYATLAAAAPVGIFRTDAQGRCIYANQRCCEIAGHSSEVALDFAWHATLHPEDRERVIHAAQQAVQEGRSFVAEYRFLHPDGMVRWVLGQTVAERDSDGQIVGYVGTVTDISDRKQAEAERLQTQLQTQQLQRELTLLESILDTILAGYWDWDLSSDRLYLSPGFKRMFGYEDEELPNAIATWHSLLFEEDLPKVLSSLERHGQSYGQIPIHEEVRYHHKDGSTVWVLYLGQVIEWSADQTPLRAIGCHIDIGDRKAYEAQLQQTNHELARATRLKNEFLATMSHELRTPLNAILGLTEGLQELVFGPINEQQHTALTTIEESGNHLLELIDDILDLSKIEAGQVQLHPTLTSIGTVCYSSLSLIHSEAVKKQLQLQVNLPSRLPDLLIDERRIRQVLINLLNNAVKFTPDGGCITLDVEWQAVPASPHHPVLSSVRITVRDTGIGIAAHNLDKLFQPFSQVDSALSRQYEGTGLGLALVKRLVELHQGTVGVVSRPGVGSQFFFQLPCPEGAIPPDKPPAEQTPSMVLPVASATAPLVLLVEDNRANVMTISSYLEAKGYRVLLAKTGREAIALAVATPPDIILMDIQMPEMNGLEAIQHLRRHPHLALVPIIALTALAMPGDREACLGAGANEYLTKPIRMQQLVSLIQQFLQGDRPQ